MARARFEAQTGHPAQAWDLLVTQLRFADSWRSDPSSSTQFTRLSRAAWTCRTIQWLCETALPDQEHVRVIEDLLKRQEGVEPLIRAVDGERLLIGEWFFHLPRDEMDKILWKERSHDTITPPGVLKATYRLSFLVTRLQAQAGRRSRRVPGPDAQTCPTASRPLSGQEGIRGVHADVPRGFLADKLIWISDYQKSFYCGLLADLRLTRAGLALLQYQQAHGTFPAALDALGQEGLIDPYTDQPLHYRPEGKGFVVYSVGEDRHDNGGVPRPEREEATPPQRRKLVEYDVVWRFSTPPARPAAGGS